MQPAMAPEDFLGGNQPEEAGHWHPGIRDKWPALMRDVSPQIYLPSLPPGKTEVGTTGWRESAHVSPFSPHFVGKTVLTSSPTVLLTLHSGHTGHLALPYPSTQHCLRASVLLSGPCLHWTSVRFMASLPSAPCSVLTSPDYPSENKNHPPQVIVLFNVFFFYTLYKNKATNLKEAINKKNSDPPPS